MIDNTVFKNPPEPTLAYTIGKDEIDGQVQTKSIQWNYSIIKTSIPFGSEDPCLPSAFDVIDPVTGAAPNPLIFDSPPCPPCQQYPPKLRCLDCQYPRCIARSTRRTRHSNPFVNPKKQKDAHTEAAALAPTTRPARAVK